MSRHRLRRAVNERDTATAERILCEAAPHSDDVINDFAGDDCLLDVLFCNTSKESPIFDAIRSGSVAMVTLLITHGCDLTCRGKSRGQTVVHACVAERNAHMLRVVLKHMPPEGARKVDAHGRTALHYLAMQTPSQHDNTEQSEAQEIAQMLLQSMDSETLSRADDKQKSCSDYASQNCNNLLLNVIENK